MAEPVAVLGVDPGSQVAGWGVVLREGSRLTVIDSGVLRPPRDGTFALRLAALHEGLAAVIAQHAPHCLAIESVFQARYARSALQLGHARGVLLLAAAQAGMAVHEYAPASVKKAVTGNGSADKEQVRFMVERLLGVRLDGPADRSDALAVAICHAQAGRLLGALKTAAVEPARPRGLRRTKG